MALAVDSRQQPSMGNMGYDPLRYPAPQFTNPWASVSAAPSAQLYPTSLASNLSGLDSNAQYSSARTVPVSMPYPGMAVSASSLVPGSTLSAGLYEQQNLLDSSQDSMNSRSYGSAYSTSTAPNPTLYAPAPASQYQMDYATSNRGPYPYDTSRRSSHPSVPSAAYFESPVEAQRQRQSSLVDLSRMNQQQVQRNSFSDALDASRGMVAMSQDITPRNIYGGAASNRSSSDSYGFPATHSSHSSISSASYNPGYYQGSSTADSSVTDYSSASESVDNMGSRTLPRPSALGGPNLPPAPQSMMGQFSSKVSSSSQKKHKCKICDKRFTRPSSLQTHMYSHTGEKPFACEVDGCGRHFSVVSNLRRHRKVHKGERDHPSPDDM